MYAILSLSIIDSTKTSRHYPLTDLVLLSLIIQVEAAEAHRCTPA
jgi:hypothetical protein